MAVDQAREDRLAPPIHHLGVRIVLLDFPRRSHGGNPVFRDGDAGMVQNGAGRVAGDYGCVGDNGGQVHSPGNN